MKDLIEVPVLIAGGGPVGLALAVELSHYDTKCLVIEQNSTTTRHPKMDLTNGRSMELFRRVGLADKIRAVGVAPEDCFDILWASDLKPGSFEVHRFPYPSARDEYWRRRTVNDGSLTLEEPLRVSQIVIEPVLKQAAEEASGVEVRFSWRLESFEQDGDGVTSVIVHTQTGESRRVRSRYLVGCDGGNSTVRAQLGVRNEGRPNVLRAFMVHFRSRAYDVLHQFGIGWHYQTSWGFVIAQNDIDEWTLHAILPPGSDESNIDPRKLVVDKMGVDFDFEILVANPWSAHYLVAESYSVGRVFMAGDACHQFMPTGGYGMNTGIAEVANLSWKLAATLHGWAGDALLNSYHIERRPIAKLSWATSERHLKVRFEIGKLYEDAGEISGTDAEAAARRLRLGRQIADLGNAENEAWGTEHGYRYTDSPVIAVEAGEAPAFDMLSYTPSTWPGSRLPHLFLSDGTAVYDHLGKWLTLLVLDGRSVSHIETAATARGIPLVVVHLDEPKARDIYKRPLILVRPDQHVAWRGDALPEDCLGLLDFVCGKKT